MAYILVVDDEEQVRGMLRAVLEEAGHRVEIACDGAEGLVCFEATPPELVITDILMPNIGGLSFIKEIRDQLPELPVIAISGGGNDGKLNFLSTARIFPGVKTLKKPFGNKELIESVRVCLAA